jgi:small GTP-binding protein
MIQKKICMLGGFAVGKTSLVARFVHSLYSDRYQTTIGVKIDKKVLNVGGTDLGLMLWDIAGEDEFHTVAASYLRGMAGYLLVVDGIRRDTLATARELRARAEQAVGPVPFVLLVNKQDRRDDWEIGEDDIVGLRGEGWTIMTTSAKTGENVEQAFLTLGRALLGTHRADHA